MLEKLKILKENKVISDGPYISAVRFYNFLVSKKYKNDLIDRFITHYAMAMERIEKNEKVGNMDDSMWAEIKNSDNFNSAQKIIEEFVEDKYRKSKLFIEESKFLYLHLSTMLQEGV